MLVWFFNFCIDVGVGISICVSIGIGMGVGIRTALPISAGVGTRRGRLGGGGRVQERRLELARQGPSTLFRRPLVVTGKYIVTLLCRSSDVRQIFCAEAVAGAAADDDDDDDE